MARKKKKRKNGFYFDYSLLFVLIFIVGFGLTMVYSTSSYTAQINYGDPEYYFKKQLFFDVGGFVIMLFIARFLDYHVLKRFAPYLFIMALISVVAVIFFGTESHGAKRWIYIGPISIQPAEIVKIAVIIMTAARMCAAGTKIKALSKNAKIFLGCALLPAGMILVITSNLSSAIIICGIVFIMSFVVYPNYRLHGSLTALIAIGYVGIREWLKKAVEAGTQMKGSFRLTRLFVWINPEKYIDDKGYQTMQGLYAIGSGGLFGKGLGKSMQKLGFIPESQNDMIFSIICEELGLFGAICVILLFIIMLWRIIYISQNSPDLFGSLLAVGVFAHIAIQVIINIAVVTNVFPNTGVTLPFISYGGSATILLLAELGIVFNISSQINLER